MKNIIKILFAFVLPLVVYAADKHPRVAELEDKFKMDAMKFLEARFPGLPFSANVSIEPLRRNFNSGYELKGEQLPFYALDEEQIQDEWDDPTATLYTLSNRVKKVAITIQVPGDLKDDELAEIQTTLVSVLRLIPARDDIKILKRDWTLFPNLKSYIIAFSVGLLCFLIGLSIISRFFATKMAKSLESLKGQSSASASAPMAQPMPMADTGSKADTSSSSDVRFNDPIKVREVALHRVDEILKTQDFIRLDNYLKLDKLGRNDYKTLGALLSLFPMAIQKELFALSSGSHWMDAFNEPGEVNYKCLEVLEDISRVKGTEYKKDWEYLLISVWRMEKDEAIPFLRDMDKEESMAILSAMPKSVSVPLAREAFPGNWAAILDPKYIPEEIPLKRCDELFKTADQIKPLVSFSLLEVYKKESDLLSYLDLSDTRTEKEIYDASPEESIVKKMRAPFYLIFSAQPAELQKLVKMFPVQQWAMALFNVPREQRKILEEHFSEKEKFFYLEQLKSFDKQRLSQEAAAKIKRSIAQAYKQLKMVMTLNTNYTSDEQQNETQEQNVA